MFPTTKPRKVASRTNATSESTAVGSSCSALSDQVRVRIEPKNASRASQTLKVERMLTWSCPFRRNYEGILQGKQKSMAPPQSRRNNLKVQKSTSEDYVACVRRYAACISI